MQCCGIGLFVEGVVMCVVPLLEDAGHQAKVLLAFLLHGDCTLVDHVQSQAVSMQNTAGFATPTVATSLQVPLLRPALYCFG